MVESRCNACFTKYVPVLPFAVVSLCLLDCATTYAAVSEHIARELNPVLSPVVYSVTFYVLKVLLTAVAVSVVHFLCRRHCLPVLEFACYFSMVCGGAYVVLNNSLVLILHCGICSGYWEVVLAYALPFVAAYSLFNFQVKST